MGSLPSRLPAPLKAMLWATGGEQWVQWGLGRCSAWGVCAQVWVPLTPAALLAVFHVTGLPGLVSPCV